MALSARLIMRVMSCPGWLPSPGPAGDPMINRGTGRHRQGDRRIGRAKREPMYCLCIACFTGKVPRLEPDSRRSLS